MARKGGAKRREGNEVEFSRIVAFSDGVFAIAITLLVLGLKVPSELGGQSLASALWGQHRGLLAYAISFAVIGRFWVVHHRSFADVVGFDGRLLGLNIFYLAWIVLIPFSSEVLGDHGDETAAVVLYAVNLAAVALVGWLMSAYAEHAGLSEVEPEEAREAGLRAGFVALVFVCSIPVAFPAPSLAPFIWLGLFLDPLDRLRGRSSARGGRP